MRYTNALLRGVLLKAKMLNPDPGVISHGLRWNSRLENGTIGSHYLGRPVKNSA